MDPAINMPDVVGELEAAFDAYEQALLRHDVAMLDRFFRDDPQTVRYGVAENLYGAAAIRTYRLACAPVHPDRRITQRVVTSFGTGTWTISAKFAAPDSDKIGRQMQTWIRFGDGWRIVAALVSVI